MYKGYFVKWEFVYLKLFTLHNFKFTEILSVIAINSSTFMWRLPNLTTVPALKMA